MNLKIVAVCAETLLVCIKVYSLAVCLAPFPFFFPRYFCPFKEPFLSLLIVSKSFNHMSRGICPLVFGTDISGGWVFLVLQYITLYLEHLSKDVSKYI